MNLDRIYIIDKGTRAKFRWVVDLDSPHHQQQRAQPCLPMTGVNQPGSLVVGTPKYLLMY